MPLMTLLLLAKLSNGNWERHAVQRNMTRGSPGRNWKARLDCHACHLAVKWCQSTVMGCLNAES